MNFSCNGILSSEYVIHFVLFVVLACFRYNLRFKTLLTLTLKRRSKGRKTQKVVFLNVCYVLVFYVILCCSVCLLLYEPFCHGAHKLDMSTLLHHFFSEHLFNLYYVLVVIV